MASLHLVEGGFFNFVPTSLLIEQKGSRPLCELIDVSDPVLTYVRMNFGFVAPH